MFSLFARGRSSHKNVIFTPPEAPIRIDEARLAAWALALGDIRASADPPPPKRVHRGMLPDVDWSNAVPMPRRRSLLRLIAGALAARMVPLASLGDSARRPLGEPRGSASEPGATPAPVLRGGIASRADAGISARRAA